MKPIVIIIFSNKNSKYDYNINNSQNKQFIKIVHWNSIKNKITDLKNFIMIEDPDVIWLNEIKINNEVELNLLINEIKHYSYETKTTGRNKGGGVLILYKASLSIRKYNNL